MALINHKFDMVTISLAIHITAGFGALAGGSVAIVARKGQRVHKAAGRLFFWCMVAVAVTAVHLSVVHPNPFLLFISLFSFYLTWSGYRAIRWKEKALSPGVRLFNNVFIPLMFISGLAMVTISVADWMEFPIPEGLNEFELLLLVFGIINSLFAGYDLLRQYHLAPSSRFWWINQHIGRIGGAFIAACTAFLVVNLTFLPALVTWLGPTLIGSPLIAYSIRRHRQRLEREKVVLD